MEKGRKCYYIGQCAFRNKDGTCYKNGCALGDIAEGQENDKRFNPSRKDCGKI